MPNIQLQIKEKFLERLAESEQIDTRTVEELRALVLDGKKVKAEDLVKIFSRSDSQDIQ